MRLTQYLLVALMWFATGNVFQIAVREGGSAWAACAGGLILASGMSAMLWVATHDPR